ncbi:hypothetical protein ACHWQZ_G017796 [Mnemiopsis leidyi]
MAESCNAPGRMTFLYRVYFSEENPLKGESYSSPDDSRVRQVAVRETTASLCGVQVLGEAAESSSVVRETIQRENEEILNYRFAAKAKIPTCPQTNPHTTHLNIRQSFSQKGISDSKLRSLRKVISLDYEHNELSLHQVRDLHVAARGRSNRPERAGIILACFL